MPNRIRIVSFLGQCCESLMGECSLIALFCFFLWSWVPVVSSALVLHQNGLCINKSSVSNYLILIAYCLVDHSVWDLNLLVSAGALISNRKHTDDIKAKGWVLFRLQVRRSFTCLSHNVAALTRT